ncbi:hypothetical protein F5Y12DRAFT_740508 [Xylaria sp. FL1777]|nr:hypothetical protein F5Y12DRAFT_740508 [Xylaria sp. FL1777]
MSYMTERAFVHISVANFRLYFLLLSCYLVHANHFVPCPTPPQVQNFGDYWSSRIAGEEDEAREATTTSNQSLSTEAIISIVALVAAVIIVPIVSKYWAHWIARRYQARQSNDINGATPQSQGPPHTIRQSPHAPSFDVDTSVAANLETMPLAHLGRLNSPGPVVVARPSNQSQEGSIHLIPQRQTASPQDTAYELEGTPVVLEALAHG